MADGRPPVVAIGVIGAGKVGRSIAMAAAIGGYPTILEDLLPGALRRAESELRAYLDESIRVDKISVAAAGAAFSRLELAGSVEDAARQADLVIEAGPEELESKIEIFTLLDKICRPGTILISNLDSLSISEISRVTYRARHCLGMRFSGAFETAKRLEIIRGLETGDDVVAAVVEVGKRLGKEVLVVAEGAG